MARSREQMIERLNKLGGELDSARKGKDKNAETNKLWEIYDLVMKIFVPESVSYSGNRSNDVTDKKINILCNILIVHSLKNFAPVNPEEDTLYRYIASRFFKRLKAYGYEYSYEKKGGCIDSVTDKLGSLVYTDDEGNAMSWEEYLGKRLGEMGKSVILNTDSIDNEDVEERLLRALEIMSAAIQFDSSRGKKNNEKRINCYRVIFSSRLIDIAKLQIPRRHLTHERETIASAKQSFFRFCYDSDAEEYSSFDELESTSLKRNKEVYGKAASAGIDFKLKPEIADKELCIPLQQNICIMYLGCEEGQNVSKPAFSVYNKDFNSFLDRVKPQYD